MPGGATQSRQGPFWGAFPALEAIWGGCPLKSGSLGLQWRFAAVVGPGVPGPGASPGRPCPVHPLQVLHQVYRAAAPAGLEVTPPAGVQDQPEAAVASPSPLAPGPARRFPQQLKCDGLGHARPVRVGPRGGQGSLLPHRRSGGQVMRGGMGAGWRAPREPLRGSVREGIALRCGAPGIGYNGVSRHCSISCSGIRGARR